jgi:hypothetical protein
MKRLAVLFGLVLALSSCKTVYQVFTGQPLWVYDSYWHLVMKSTAANAKELQVIDSGDIQAQVDAYNAAHTDSQLFVESEETEIADSPPATVYIVNAITHEIIKGFVNVDRSSFVDSAALWSLEAQSDGGVMYVDSIPPPPLPQDETYKYYLYLIDVDGSILFSEQCTPEIFPFALNAYTVQSYSYPGSHVVHGKLYHG